MNGRVKIIGSRDWVGLAVRCQSALFSFLLPAHAGTMTSTKERGQQKMARYTGTPQEDMTHKMSITKGRKVHSHHILFKSIENHPLFYGNFSVVGVVKPKTSL